ncbi:hypothetical protein LCGC14_1744720 [marine sediment metagenome]|uniref:Uncharacterized protein n=1 Tax=marine sediment metagenome TaxID=412755 RepID=A0A0F9H5Q1_9ZZZZ
MSTFTYDITDNTGKLRLAISDIDLTTTVGVRSDWTVLFTDEELGVFLSNASSDINLAAFYALNAIAASRALLAKSMSLGDYSIDLKSLADSLRAQAKVYYELSVNVPSGLAAEVAQTDFTARDIIYNKELRTG